VQVATPEWRAPWKLMRVLSGHLGWVRCVAVDPTNEWFATGSADRTIKIWDLASGQLKLTLTGHIHTVRGLAISHRHPYLFSVAEDKMVKVSEDRILFTHKHTHTSFFSIYCYD
jgi:pleiotropic regulator 1